CHAWTWSEWENSANGLGTLPFMYSVCVIGWTSGRVLQTTPSLFVLYSDCSSGMFGWNPNVCPGPALAGVLIGRIEPCAIARPGPPRTPRYAAQRVARVRRALLSALF